MSTFDISDPPTSYRKFRKSVLNTIEEAEVTEDEEYPICMFLVNRENEGDIIYPQEIIEELEEEVDDEDEIGGLPVPFLVHKLFPDRLRKFNSKMFAVVFQGTHTDNDGDEFDIVIVLSGSAPGDTNMLGEIDLLQSYIVIEDEVCELEPWERMNLEHLPELVMSFRQAIVNQG